MNKYPSNLPEIEIPSTVINSGRKSCESTGKACFGSKHEARNSLVGQLASKSIRVYQCDEEPDHWHLTKTWKK